MKFSSPLHTRPVVVVVPVQFAVVESVCVYLQSGEVAAGSDVEVPCISVKVMKLLVSTNILLYEY